MAEPTRDERTKPPKAPVEGTASSADEHTGGLPAGAPPAADGLAFLEKPQA